MWKEDTECEGCNLHEQVFCKPKSKYAMLFIAPFPLIVVPAVIQILFFSNFNLFLKIAILVGWFAYGFFFLNIWESRMLCNHCPYYANDSQKSLRCPIDKGKLKTGKYDPGPSSTSEKIQFIIGALLMIGFPIPFLIIGELWVSLILLGIGFIMWIIILQLKICTDCVNFACPLNRVPKEIRNEFIKKNPVIREAWEKKGYNFD